MPFNMFISPGNKCKKSWPKQINTISSFRKKQFSFFLIPPWRDKKFSLFFLLLYSKYLQLRTETRGSLVLSQLGYNQAQTTSRTSHFSTLYVSSGKVLKSGVLCPRKQLWRGAQCFLPRKHAVKQAKAFCV